MKPLQLLRLWRITCQSSFKQPTPTPHPPPHLKEALLIRAPTHSPPPLFWDGRLVFFFDVRLHDLQLHVAAFSLLSGDGKDEQPKSTGFSNCTLSFYSYLFFAFSGNSLFCWISDPTAKAVAVVTPVCLALVFNAACLTKCLYAIHRLKKVCHSQSTGNIIKNIFQLSCNLL